MFLVSDQSVTHLDVLLEHQRILHTVNDFKKELLLLQESMIGHGNLVGG